MQQFSKLSQGWVLLMSDKLPSSEIKPFDTKWYRMDFWALPGLIEKNQSFSQTQLNRMSDPVFPRSHNQIKSFPGNTLNQMRGKKFSKV
jgi:hypothetical protein